ncbi:MAG: DUF167 domain-containing protein [Chthonomonadetes bacterium]|nr:DUF167 domain-containing protein [Chthonomonadetes bacterium]
MNVWTLKVRVTPRASRNEIESWDGEILRIRVTAPPAEGQANEACRDLLAKALGVPKSKIVLVQGAHHREKVFRVEGGDRQVLEQFVLQH